MIITKQDLNEYIKQDKNQLGITRNHPRPFTDEIWKYEITLRKYEYWINQTSKASTLMCFIYKVIFHMKCVKLGIFIGPNTCGKGLSIAHLNCIEINGAAQIGDNLRIHEGVTIGASGRGAPTIGNNVFLATGAKIIGEITVADNCVVGANAVVIKDVLETGITVGGVPAKKISNNSSERFIYWYLNSKGENYDT